MKNYTITVNGNVYDVTVEETGSTPSSSKACSIGSSSCKASSTSGICRCRKY